MYEKELEMAIYAAKEAEKIIKEIYNTRFEVEIKSDDSPVTKADKEADNLMKDILHKAFPDYGFLTEESVDTDERFSKEFVWIIDPVDGTKEFVSRNGQFTTNIALARNGKIVVGIINVPMLNVLYYAVAGEGAFKLDANGSRTRIHVSNRKVGELRPVKSISHFKPEEKEFMENNASCFGGPIEEVGAANKFCVIAEGKKDYFIRLSNGTKEWDIASGDLIVTEAGGIMIEPNGKKFTYNRHDVYNRNGYIVCNLKENILYK